MLCFERTDRPGRWGVILSAVTVGLMVGVGLLHLHRSTTMAILWTDDPVTEITGSEGHAYWIQLGHEFWSQRDGGSSAMLFEDGAPLPGPDALHVGIREIGLGRFSFWNDGVLFSSSDNTDPRTNGRTYRIVAPRIVSPVIWDGTRLLCALALAWSAFFWISYGRGAAATVKRRTWSVCALLLMVALAVRVAALVSIHADPVRHTVGVRVMDVPFSDGRDWDYSGEMLAGGQGLYPAWKARRPFYAIFLASLYFWTGASSAVAVGANVILGALMVPLVFLVGRQVGGGLVGFFAALVMAAAPSMVMATTVVLSETLGAFLLVLGAWFTIRGLDGEQRWSLLLGGVAFGLSNLTRPASLLAAPVLVLIVAATVWRRRREPRRAIEAAIAIGLGMAIAVGPWMIRQKIQYGFWSLSDNAAASLYAATSPAYGQWTPEVNLEPLKAGVGRNIREPYEFFMAGAWENLAANPGWYARHAAGAMYRSLADLAGVFHQGEGKLIVIGLILSVALITARREGSVVRAIVSGVVVVVVALVLLNNNYLATVGLAAALLIRAGPGLVVASMAFFTSLALGMLGGSEIQRLQITDYWISAIFGCLGASALVRLALLPVAGSWRRPSIGWRPWLADLGCFAEPPQVNRRVAPPAGRLALPVIVAVLFGVPGFVMLYRHTLGWAPVPLYAVITPQEAQRYRGELAAHWPADSPVNMAPLLERAGSAVTVTRNRITRFVYELPADVIFARHWWPTLEPRPYDRTVFIMDQPKGRFEISMYGGRVPSRWINEPCVIFAWLKSLPDEPSGSLLETFAIAPCHGPEGPPDWSRAIFCDEREHLELVSSLLERAITSEEMPGR